VDRVFEQAEATVVEGALPRKALRLNFDGFDAVHVDLAANISACPLNRFRKTVN